MLDNIREVGSSGVSMCDRATVSSVTQVAVSSVSSVSVGSVSVSGPLSKMKSTSVSSTVDAGSSVTIGHMLDNNREVGSSGESMCDRATVSSVTQVAVSSESSVSVGSVSVSGPLSKVESTSVSSTVDARSSVTIGHMLDNIREVGSSGVSMCDRATVSSVTQVAVSSVSSVSIGSVSVSRPLSHTTYQESESEHICSVDIKQRIPM